MTIHLPKELESSINAAVLSGHFASADDLVTEDRAGPLNANSSRHCSSGQRQARRSLPQPLRQSWKWWTNCVRAFRRKSF